MRLFLLIICFFTLVIGCSRAFVQPTSMRKVNRDEVQEHDTFPLQTAVLRPSPVRFLSKRDDEKVNVNLIYDIDSFTLTAIGFGLIAFNFFVLANMGDAGLAGIIARIMNAFG